jgi:hypothetical protein
MSIVIKLSRDSEQKQEKKASIHVHKVINSIHKVTAAGPYPNSGAGVTTNGAGVATGKDEKEDVG